MNKIEELLMRKCPNGVEYKTVGEIATNIFRGSGIKRDEVTESGTPCVRYGEIYTTQDISFDSCISHVDEDRIKSPKYFGYGDILFAITCESVEDIAKSCAYIGNEKCIAGGDIVVVQHNQNPKFLSYVLSTQDVRKQKSRGKIKSKVVHASVQSIKDLIIPIPPLDIQAEVVRILDEFYKALNQIDEKLQEEIMVRQQQFEFYQEKLSNSFRDVATILLSEIADIGTGSSNTNEELDSGDQPFCVRSQEEKRKNEYEFDETAIITSGDGVGVGKIFHYVEGKYALHQRAYRIHIHDNRISPKFFYQYMKATFLPYIQKNAFNSSVTSIRRPMLNNFPVPMVSLDSQEKFISLMTNLESNTNNLINKIEKERIARHQQYEYYRDRLLTFPKQK